MKDEDVKYESDGDNNRNSCVWNGPGKESGGIENLRKNWYHPDCYLEQSE